MKDTSVVQNTSPLPLIAANPGGTEPPDFSKFRFRYIGKSPVLLDRITTPESGSNYRSPSPEASNNMEMESSDDNTFDVSQPRTTPGSRKSLLEALTGEGLIQEAVLSPAGANTHTEGMEDSRRFTTNSSIPVNSVTSDVSTPKHIASGVASLNFIQPSNSAQAATTSSTSTYSSVNAVGSVAEHALRLDEQDEMQPYPPSSPSPLSVINHLSDIVHERAELEKIRDLGKQFAEEKEEFFRRREETLRAMQRVLQQAERVMSIAEESSGKMETLILKQEKRLENDKMKLEADIAARRDAEKRDQLRRQAQAMESRQRQQEEERRRAIEDELCRKEEEARILQEELQEAERRRREEQLQEIENRRKEEERLKAQETAKREQQEKEELARKQEEMRVKLAERRKKAEAERQQKEKEKEEDETKKQAEEELRQKLYQEKKAAALARKWNASDPSSNNLEVIKEQSPQDESPLLPSAPSSSSSSQTQPSPDQSSAEMDEKPKRFMVKHEGNSSSAAAKQQLKTSFVPASTEAGKLVSTDTPVTSTKLGDGGTTQQPSKTSNTPRGPKTNTKTLKTKIKTAPPIKKEPVSPTLPATHGQQHATDPVPIIHTAPAVTNLLPAVLPPRVLLSGPAILRAAAPPHPPRLPPDLPRRPNSATTREPLGSLWRSRPVSPIRSPSPARTPPRPFVRARSATPPRPPSPLSPTSRRSRSPVGRGARPGYDHYSPPSSREHWSADYRTRPEFARRDPSPPSYLQRKRPRDNDSWVPSDDPRTGVPLKRRAVRDLSPVARIPPRSPPSPRHPYTRRTSGQERPTPIATWSNTQIVTDAYDTRRRTASGPLKQPSKRINDSQSSLPTGGAVPTPRSKPNSTNAPEGTLLDRMSHNRSPPGPRVPNRKAHVPLEYRLTSGPGTSMSLGERLS